MQKKIIRSERGKEREIAPEDFYSLRFRAVWTHLKSESFSFWMICGYLIVEYVRPQSIIPTLDVLPWAQVFVLFALVGLFFDRQFRWVSDIANLWMTLFLAVIILASATATYPAVSWRHFMDFFGWYVIYFLIINIVNTEKRFLIFIAIFLLASFKLSSFGARTWAMRGFAFTDWGLMGPPGFFQNSGELAVQMLMFSPVAYKLVLFLRAYISPSKYYLLLLFPITGAMTVLGASSRGGQLGLVYQGYRMLLKGRLTLRTIVIVGVLAMASWHLLPGEQKERFSAAGADRTSQQRLLYWTHGIDMIKEHPLLGVGYFNFPAYYERHYPEDMLYESAQLPHNIFIQVGTDAGLLGLLIFGLLLYRNVSCAKEICKLSEFDATRKPFAALASGLLIAMWGFVIAGQFVTVTYYPFFWLNLAMTVALGNITRRHYQSLTASSNGKKSSLRG